jgi:hypothetical protein
VLETVQVCYIFYNTDPKDTDENNYSDDNDANEKKYDISDFDEKDDLLMII